MRREFIVADHEIPVQANINSYARAINDIFRVRVELSDISSNWPDAIKKTLNNQVHVIEESFQKEDERVSGFLSPSITTATGYVERCDVVEHVGDEAAVRKCIEDNNLRPVSKGRLHAENIYIAPDEVVWTFAKNGGEFIVTQSGTDDVGKLLASAANERGGKMDKPVIKASERAVIAYVSRNGAVRTAISVAEVKGDNNRIQILQRKADGGFQKSVASVWQVIAKDTLETAENSFRLKHEANHFPTQFVEEAAKMEPLEYYRYVWNMAPDIFNGVKEIFNKHKLMVNK